jgi:hypothetical protein
MKLAPSDYCVAVKQFSQNPELYGFFLNSSPKRHSKFSLLKLKNHDIVYMISFLAQAGAKIASLTTSSPPGDGFTRRC